MNNTLVPPAYEVLSTNPVTGTTAVYGFNSFANADAAVARFTAAGQDAWIDCSGQDYEGPSCSICDALGHGYPGGGPCPLEDRGYDEDDSSERWLESLEEGRR